MATERKVFAREMVIDGEVKKVKLTQKELYTEILEKVADDELHAEFINYQIEMLNRKTANRSVKADSEENIALMQNILDIMGNNSMMIKDIVKAFAENGTIYSPQKITAMMSKLKNNDKVIETVEKNVRYFTRVVE